MVHGFVDDYGTRWVLKDDHQQALAEKDLALAQANRHKEELFQKLAEKDREIAHLQDVYIKQRHKQEDAYQQLMEQAVRFAEGYKGKLEKEHGGKVFQYGQYELVAQFLQSPEVQAWKEHKS